MDPTVYSGNPDQKKYLTQLFQEQGLPLSDEQASRFMVFYEKLIEKNRVMNLTAITDFEEVCTKHFLDSVMLLKAVPEIEEKLRNTSSGYRLIDVGTGAGFPGIPIKIMLPDLDLTLLDALQKRIDFLKEAAASCRLSGISFLHERAEEGVRKPVGLRETYDAAVSRAVAYLPVLLEYCLPYVKKGGLFAAYKSGKVQEELEASLYAAEVLGAEWETVYEFSLPDGSGRTLVIFRKTAETPEQYPRRAKKIEKSPLLSDNCSS